MRICASIYKKLLAVDNQKATNEWKINLLMYTLTTETST